MNLQSYRCKYWYNVKAFFLGKWAGHSINRDCSLLVMCRCLLNGSTERTLLRCTDNCVPLLVLALRTCADAIQSLSSCKNQLTADPVTISCRHHQKQTLRLAAPRRKERLSPLRDLVSFLPPHKVSLCLSMRPFWEELKGQKRCMRVKNINNMRMNTSSLN